MKDVTTKAKEANQMTKRILLIAPLLLIFATPVIDDPIGPRGIGITYCTPDDLALLDLDWFMTWSVSTGYLSDSRYVPCLCGNGQTLQNNIDALPSDWDRPVLVFSEPDIPGAGEIDPEIAATTYLAIKAQFPDAVLITGGLAFGDSLWANDFLSYLDPYDYPKIWHVHGYVWGDLKSEVTDRWETLHDLVNVPIWVTEFGSPSANTNLLSQMLLYMESVSWIDRYSMFPCRIQGGEPWFPPSWSLYMAPLDWDYNLTDMGIVYKDFTIFQTFIPLFIP